MTKSREEILNFVNSTNWYHKVDLGGGIITPGHNFDKLWDLIRSVRDQVDYKNKIVLDLGSIEGMWAFEAEKLGAGMVVATDVYFHKVVKRFHFCKEVLNSSVIPYYNVSPYLLHERLDVFLQENWEDQKPYDRLFDIVQHLGLLYHLQNPMLSLAQARSVMKEGGILLFETAVVANVEQPIMLFNGTPPNNKHIYDDITTWWAPAVPCLKAMLKANLFEVDESSIKLLHQQTIDGLDISRAAMTARAIGKNEIDQDFYREITRTYRTPGLNIH
jgi:tRNA (mo5U34)-methyltransferase